MTKGTRVKAKMDLTHERQGEGASVRRDDPGIIAADRRGSVDVDFVNRAGVKVSVRIPRRCLDSIERA